MYTLCIRLLFLLQADLDVPDVFHPYMVEPVALGSKDEDTIWLRLPYDYESIDNEDLDAVIVHLDFRKFYKEK